MKTAEQQMMLMQQLPERYRIRVELKVQDAQQAGVILHVKKEMKEGYYLYVEPNRERLVMRSWIRMSEEGGKTFPYDVELETPVRHAEDGRYHLEIIAEGNIGTAYVNEEAALSFRRYDLSVPSIQYPMGAHALGTLQNEGFCQMGTASLCVGPGHGL